MYLEAHLADSQDLYMCSCPVGICGQAGNISHYLCSSPWLKVHTTESGVAFYPMYHFTCMPNKVIMRLSMCQ